ncbi:MAG: MFS family permease [Paracoccaceae bacterium]|jgi:MFS family permease
MFSNRWAILIVLFFARMTMGFQFQSLAALSPLVIESYAVSLADIGFMIGLYLAPGVIVAIPGGAIATRFGDKRIIILSMLLMMIGAALVSFGPNWGWFTAGRLLAGAGGVVLNVVMTKMLVDWFAGREISTAIAIFINSWPVGIALALLTLPSIAAYGGLYLAWITVLLVIGAGLVLFAVGYRAAPGAAASALTGIKLARLPVYALCLAGAIWALYNAALAMVFSFGPALLSERGWDLTIASSATSVFMIVIAISVPIGGILADRTGRRDTIMMISFVAYTILMPMVLFVPAWATPVIFVVVGLLFGLAAGPIMTLPSLVLRPEARAFGMGVFYTIYYAIMMIAPALAGSMADRSGSIGMAFFLGSVMLIISMIALGLFRQATAKPKATI